MLITEQQLKEWEEIEKGASAGPWDCDNSNEGIFELCRDYLPMPNDFVFIDMARTAMPLLIQTVRELQEENRALHGISRKVVLNLPEALAQERNEIADFIRGGIRSDMSDVIKFVLSNLEDLIRKRE